MVEDLGAAFSQLTGSTESSGISAEVQVLRWDIDGTSLDVSTTTAAAKAIANAQKHSSRRGSSAYHLLAKSGRSIMGVHVGSQINPETAARLIQSFINKEVRASPAVGRTAAQLCSGDSIGPRVFGIIANSTGDLGIVQDTLHQ
jgi:hypothetical protein